ncbi:hypothetical protein PIB30_073303 [Stylosanthes scabra]|uniref:Uncharacterized protein n=1 Tax=Stylosanthes scabra TaxID=79078 RepID=A0ABU6YNA2_9FABA|nr:hypothetical protein [Stylosanthes scabra]
MERKIKEDDVDGILGSIPKSKKESNLKYQQCFQRFEDCGDSKISRSFSPILLRQLCHIDFDRTDPNLEPEPMEQPCGYGSENDIGPSAATTRPNRTRKKPIWMRDYVPS